MHTRTSVAVYACATGASVRACAGEWEDAHVGIYKLCHVTRMCALKPMPTSSRAYQHGMRHPTAGGMPRLTTPTPAIPQQDEPRYATWPAGRSESREAGLPSAQEQGTIVCQSVSAGTIRNLEMSGNRLIDSATLLSKRARWVVHVFLVVALMASPTWPLMLTKFGERYGIPPSLHVIHSDRDFCAGLAAHDLPRRSAAQICDLLSARARQRFPI